MTEEQVRVNIRGTEHDDLLRETRRQVKKESRVLERTRLALIRDINTGTRDMRAMGARLHKVT